MSHDSFQTVDLFEIESDNVEMGVLWNLAMHWSWKFTFLLEFLEYFEAQDKYTEPTEHYD